MLSMGINDIDSAQDTHACFVQVWLLDFRFRCWEVVHESLRLVARPCVKILCQPVHDMQVEDICVFVVVTSDGIWRAGPECLWLVGRVGTVLSQISLVFCLWQSA